MTTYRLHVLKETESTTKSYAVRYLAILDSVVLNILNLAIGQLRIRVYTFLRGKMPYCTRCSGVTNIYKFVVHASFLEDPSICNESR